jgi:hypothetical protein
MYDDEILCTNVNFNDIKRTSVTNKCNVATIFVIFVFRIRLSFNNSFENHNPSLILNNILFKVMKRFFKKLNFFPKNQININKLNTFFATVVKMAFIQFGKVKMGKESHKKLEYNAKNKKLRYIYKN